MDKGKWPDKKKLLYLLVCQLLIMGIGAGISTVRKNQVYTWDASVWNTDENGNAHTDAVTLPRGIYRVHLEYACDSDMAHFISVTQPEGEQGRVLCGGEHLNRGLGRTDFDLWVESGEAVVAWNISYGGGWMEPGELTVVQTDRDIYRNMFRLFVVFLALDALILFVQAYRNGTVSKEKAMVFGALFGTVLIASIPLGTDRMYGGSDITYHLLRIGNIKEGLRMGQLPVRLDPEWQFGNGYASSTCYGQLFLYFPAFLRLIGLPLNACWNWFLFGLNGAACVTSYYCFSRIFGSRRTGVCCSILYTLSVYRLYKMYSWSAVGEVQAMIFFPLILWGTVGLYTKTAQEIREKKYWVILTLGVSGLIQCHVLSLELTVVFLGITCVVFLRRTLQREVLLSWMKAIGMVCLLNAWFLVPFLDYMTGMDMVIHHVSARTIQENGLMPAQLFMGFFHRGFSRNLVDNGLVNVEAMGTGAPLTAGLLLFVFLGITGRSVKVEKGLRSQKKEIIALGTCGAVLAILAMVMSLNIFPWDRLQFVNRITASMISSIQYPNRFLMVATLLLCMTAGAAVKLLGMRSPGAAGAALALLAAFGVTTAVFYTDHLSASSEPLMLYDESGMGTGYLSGAEYLLQGTDPSLLTWKEPEASEGVLITESTRDMLQVEFVCANPTGSEGYADLALQNYKGFTAVTPEGEKLSVINGPNNCVRVVIPPGFAGSVSVTFESMWYWRAAEVISVVTAAVWFVSGRKHERKIFRKKQ